MAEFSWDGDDSTCDVVLGWQPRTAVYTNQSGGVVIRQEDRDGYCADCGDETISLTPMGALAVAWRLIELAHEIGLPEPCRGLMGEFDPGPSRPIAQPAAQGAPEPDSEPGLLLVAMQREAGE